MAPSACPTEYDALGNAQSQSSVLSVGDKMVRTVVLSERRARPIRPG